MEIIVASQSPLGQYLAQLDAEADGKDDARTQWLSTTHSVASKRSRPRQCTRVGSGSMWLQRSGQWVQRCIEVVAIRRLVLELCALYPTIREDLQQAAGHDPGVFTAPSTCWWKRHVAVAGMLSGVHVVGMEERQRPVTVTLGTLVALAALAVTKRGIGQVVLMQTLGGVVGVVTLVLLGLELSVRLLHAWYRCRSRRLVASLKAFVAALEAFDKVFACSLTLTKRAELASRGYRLGTGLLPPIGRLEASNADNGADGASIGSVAASAMQNHLRCIPLRRKLRAVNEQLHIRASILVKEGELTTRNKIQDCVEEDETLGKQCPSVLLSTLTKQHNRSVMLLEGAVHTVLVRKLACACSYRGDAVVSWSLFRTLGSYRLTVEHLIETLSTWMDDLEAWNTTGDPMALQARASDTKSSHREQEKQRIAVPVASDVRLKDIASQLHELRSTSETLTALAVAAQYELLSVDSAAERLASSRDAMRSITQQLHEAWDRYDCALSALTCREDHSDDVSGGAANQDEGDRDSEPTTLLELSSVTASEDPKCTVVFSGTSTGDEGFDLQALLKQQAGSAATTFLDPTPRFVRELREVLAQRQARAHPGPTKQVDHDPPVLLTPAPAPPPSAADAMFALPRCGQPRRPSSNSPRDYKRSEMTPSAFNLELSSTVSVVPDITA